MNQPRYSDSGGGGGVGYSDNRRSTHSTGRSNFGGGGGRRGRRGGKGPIGNWIQNRRQRRARRQRSSNGGAVGTEANAIQNIAKNAGFFNYPAEGFVTPIEHSLLYAMIEYPERYPESVVKKEIEEEEFDVYMYFNSEKRKNHSDGNGGGGGNDNRQQESEENEAGEVEEGENEDEGGHAQADEEDEGRVSYAQLSALAALSAEKNPSTASTDQDMPAANRTAASRNRNSSNNTEGRSGGGNSTDNKDSGGGQSAPPEEQISVGQALVRKLLRTITRYSDAHGLDRQTEIREFLAPIEKRCQLRNEKAALQQLLPAYAGYTLSLVTGNPLPLLIGAAALAGPDPMNEENGNVSNFRAVGSRAGDMETAGLLDECESD